MTYLSKGVAMSYEDMARDAGCTTEEEIRQMAQMIEEDHRRQMMEEEEQEQEQEDEFCPACDAGVGHCIGPHKGSDEIPF